MSIDPFLIVLMMQQALLAMSLYLALMSGQLSLASPAFYTLGGYVAALLSTSSWSQAWLAGEDQLLPLWLFGLELLLAGLLCFVLAYGVGRLVLGLRGIYLALATVAMVEIVRVSCLNLEFTGGAVGIFGIPQVVSSQVAYLWIFLPILGLSGYGIWRLERSRLGRSWRAIREDEHAAAAMGLALVEHKSLSFALGACLAGITGAASAHLMNTWNARQGTFDTSINILAYVMIGGPWSVLGVSAGAALLTALPEVLRPLQDFRLIVNGALVLLASLYLPKGLIQEAWLRRRYQGKKDLSGEAIPTSRAGAELEGPMLRLENISVQFGGLRAVESLSLEVKRGEIFGIIGPNGAGKTTVFNVITGFTQAQQGTIYLANRAITQTSVHGRVHLGLARTFQNLRLLRQQSVLDNVLASNPNVDRTEGLSEELRLKQAYSCLELCGLADKLDQLAGSLSYGNQRRLELARALMLRPKLLLLDEPVAGMNTREKEDMQTLMRRLRDELGLTIVLIEHHVPLVLGLCDRIAVLNFGNLIALGQPEHIQSHPEVRQAYLGPEGAR